MHDARRLGTPFVHGATRTTPSAVSLAVVEQSFYIPRKEFSTLRVRRRFGSTVRGTKGLINKSNGSINIQTVLKEREKGNSACWRTALLPPFSFPPCNGNLLFSTPLPLRLPSPMRGTEDRHFRVIEERIFPEFSIENGRTSHLQNILTRLSVSLSSLFPNKYKCTLIAL